MQPSRAGSRRALDGQQRGRVSTIRLCRTSHLATKNSAMPLWPRGWPLYRPRETPRRSRTHASSRCLQPTRDAIGGWPRSWKRCGILRLYRKIFQRKFRVAEGDWYRDATQGPVRATCSSQEWRCRAAFLLRGQSRLLECSLGSDAGTL